MEQVTMSSTLGRLVEAPEDTRPEFIMITSQAMYIEILGTVVSNELVKYIHSVKQLGERSSTAYEAFDMAWTQLARFLYNHSNQVSKVMYSGRRYVLDFVVAEVQRQVLPGSCFPDRLCGDPISTRTHKDPLSQTWRSEVMNDDSLGNGPQPWMSITGQPLDLGFSDAGFQGTLRSCKCPDEPG